jgi:hypothetical protein
MARARSTTHLRRERVQKFRHLLNIAYGAPLGVRSINTRFFEQGLVVSWNRTAGVAGGFEGGVVQHQDAAAKEQSDMWMGPICKNAGFEQDGEDPLPPVE